MTGQELLTLRADYSSVAFSPDGQRLATGLVTDDLRSSIGRPAEVVVLDAQTGQPQQRFRLDERISSGQLAFSPDGQRLVAASNGASRALTVWALATGQEICTLKGHTHLVLDMTFSPDGRRLATCSVDSTVKLWDLTTGRELLTLQGHTGRVGRVAFTPDGRRLLSVGADGVVREWDATPLSPEVEARALVHSLSDRFPLQAEVIERVTADPYLSDAVRRAAVQLAKTLKEDPSLLNRISRDVVRASGRDTAEYRLALRQAETAVRISPTHAPYLTTLGMAQYRAGQSAAALTTLQRADELGRGWFRDSTLADVTFLAMTYHQLGQKEKAREYLQKLREQVKALPPTPVAAVNEGRVFLAEAEALIEGPPK
jgi:hypothetical protein